MPSRLAVATLLVLAATASGAQPLPAFPVDNVAESFHGTVVDDPYRSLEDTKNPQVAAWMKAQAEHARRTLEGLGGYAARDR